MARHFFAASTYVHKRFITSGSDPGVASADSRDTLLHSASNSALAALLLETCAARSAANIAAAVAASACFVAVSSLLRATACSAAALTAAAAFAAAECAPFEGDVGGGEP